MFPNASDASIYQNHWHDPSLWTENFWLMFLVHDVLPVFVPKEVNIEVWQEPKMRTFE